MEELFLNKILIKSVMHIKNVDIPLSKTGRKNLIITGKNGVGKTSFLVALKRHLETYFEGEPDGEIPLGHYFGRYYHTEDKQLKEEYNREVDFWSSRYNGAGYNETWHHIGDDVLERIYEEAEILTDTTSDQSILPFASFTQQYIRDHIQAYEFLRSYI